jgi:hypothetical protein
MNDQAKPTENERAAGSRYYWFNMCNGQAQFFWDDWEVSEEEYRRNARPEHVTYLDEVLQGASRGK